MLLRIILLFNAGFELAIALQCVDHNNQPVDWYVIYKLPKEKKHKDELVQQGLAYTYITSNDINSSAVQWQFSALSINDTRSLPALTLNPYYAKQQLKLKIMYNDEVPNGPTSFDKGHTKGTIMADSKSGFWLVHSVPHFPPTDQYSYPHTGTHFGQSFLCISLSVDQMDIVGKQLRYNEPYIYSSFISPDIINTLPNLNAAIKNLTVDQAPWYNKETLISLNNSYSFISFAKGKQFLKDLYADWLSTELNDDLLVETWPNGPNRLPSDCEKAYKVFNVHSVNVSIPSSIIVEFKSTSDHSKWTVTKTLPWICVGDINRAEHQEHRGGGTVCLKHQSLWKNYKSVIESIENCKSN